MRINSHSATLFEDAQ